MRVEAWSDGVVARQPGAGRLRRAAALHRARRRRPRARALRRLPAHHPTTAWSSWARSPRSRRCAARATVTMTTDSQYVCNAFNQNWIGGWQRRGWKTASKQPVKNVDLWRRLLRGLRAARGDVGLDQGARGASEKRALRRARHGGRRRVGTWRRTSASTGSPSRPRASLCATLRALPRRTAHAGRGHARAHHASHIWRGHPLRAAARPRGGRGGAPRVPAGATRAPTRSAARFSTLPSRAAVCHDLGRKIQSGHVTQALLALRDGVGHLPAPDERVGRAFALGILGHYALDRAAHPFVVAQQRALCDVEPSLGRARARGSTPS